MWTWLLGAACKKESTFLKDEQDINTRSKYAFRQVKNIEFNSIVFCFAQTSFDFYLCPYPTAPHPTPDFLVEKDSDYCMCEMPCNVTRYGKELSMVKIPSKASAKYLAKKYNKSEQYIGWVPLLLPVLALLQPTCHHYLWISTTIASAKPKRDFKVKKHLKRMPNLSDLSTLQMATSTSLHCGVWSHHFSNGHRVFTGSPWIGVCVLASELCRLTAGMLIEWVHRDDKWKNFSLVFINRQNIMCLWSQVVCDHCMWSGELCIYCGFHLKHRRELRRLYLPDTQMWPRMH